MIIGNYFTIAIRNFTRRKLYSFINALGLSIAVAFCSLVYLFITDELSFDDFHANGNRIYRINNRQLSTLNFEHGEADPYRYYSVLPSALGASLRNEVSGVEYVTQLKRGGKQTIKLDDRAFAQEIVFADSSFFDVFSFERLAGSYSQLFNQPNDAVITPETAVRFFGDADPIGKTFYLDYEESATPGYTVRAVVKCPSNSSVVFEVLLPLESYKPFLNKSWNSNSYHTFAMLNPEVRPEQFEITLNNLLANKRGEWAKSFRMANNIPADVAVEEYTLTSLTDVHFDKKVGWPNVSDAKYSWILGGISLLIMLIASINYISFALTSSASRTKEIAIRKTTGATRRQIFQQFNLESFTLVFFSSLIGVGLALTLLPFFNALTQKTISVFSVDLVQVVIFFIVLIVVLGITAGSYPSFFASRIMPAAGLRSSTTGMRAFFVKPLIVLQFSMSAFLMVSSIIMYKQLHFIATKDLGYNGDNVIVIPTNLGWGVESDQAIERFRNETKDDLNIEGVSGTSGSFIRGSMSLTFDYNNSEHEVYVCRADHDYISLMTIDLVSGRNFMAGSVGDSSSVLVNETLVAELGWTDPLNETLDMYGKKGLKVVGVMKDYHFLSLEEEIKPMLLCGSSVMKSFLISLVVKLNGDDLPIALEAAEKSWRKLYPDKPFDYVFADAEVESQYASYNRWMKITGAATTLALIIASLGLFGLAGINATNRTKEISIRKVLGADFAHIFLQLNRPFFVLAAIAFVIALPVSWQLMKQWLNNFKYRIDPGWELFAMSVGLGLLVVVATLSYHSIKASRVNPAETLKSE